MQTTLNLTVEGVSPLLMHADTCTDPMNEMTKALKPYTSKKSPDKTDEDHQAIATLEFRAGMYHDEELGPYVPAANLIACIRDGGRMRKLGTKIVMAMEVLEPKIPLQYEGPRDMAGLEADPRFWDRRSVKIGRAKTMRTRPVFNHWRLDFTVMFDPEILNPDTVKEVIGLAGSMKGLMDFRPQHGRFRLVNGVE